MNLDPRFPTPSRTNSPRMGVGPGEGRREGILDSARGSRALPIVLTRSMSPPKGMWRVGEKNKLDAGARAARRSPNGARTTGESAGTRLDESRLSRGLAHRTCEIVQWPVAADRRNERRELCKKVTGSDPGWPSQGKR